MLRKASDFYRISRSAQSALYSNSFDYNTFIIRNEEYKYQVDCIYRNIQLAAEKGRTNIYLTEKLPETIHDYFIKNGFKVDQDTIYWNACDDLPYMR